jgi:hypothetical protein
MEREVHLRKRRMGNVVINYLAIHQLGNEVIMRCYYSSPHHPHPHKIIKRKNGKQR